MTANEDVIKLPDALTIDTTENFLSQIVACSEALPDTLTVDATELENITTPGIQALLVLANLLLQHGDKIKLIDPNEVIQSVFTQAGLSNVLKQWSVAETI